MIHKSGSLNITFLGDVFIFSREGTSDPYYNAGGLEHLRVARSVINLVWDCQKVRFLGTLSTRGKRGGLASTILSQACALSAGASSCLTSLKGSQC
jgi:hypothetical protein